MGSCVRDPEGRRWGICGQGADSPTAPLTGTLIPMLPLNKDQPERTTQLSLPLTYSDCSPFLPFRISQRINPIVTSLWILHYPLGHRSPTPGPRTGTGLWPVRNWATQQVVSGRWPSKASSATPYRSHYRLNHCSHYCLNHPPLPPHSVEKLSSMKPVPGAKNLGTTALGVVYSPLTKFTQIIPVWMCHLFLRDLDW